MIGKNKTWCKQITAAFFMLVLFAVTIIQVLHTHSFSTTTVTKIKAGNQAIHLSANELNISSGNCFVCDYQLTKDADASYFLPQIKSNTAFYSFPSFSYSFTPYGITVFIETRGPPSFI